MASMPLIWLETIREVAENRSEETGESASHTALMVMKQGFKGTAVG